MSKDMNVNRLGVDAIEARMQLSQKYFPNGVKPNEIALLDEVERMLGKAFSDGYKMGETFAEEMWSNNACLGYAILGAKQLGYKEAQIRELVLAVYGQFDWHSVEEAKNCYNESPY